MHGIYGYGLKVRNIFSRQMEKIRLHSPILPLHESLQTQNTDTVNDNMRAKENCLMSIPKNRRDNANKIRKQTPHPHGKIKSFRELAEE